MATLVVRTIDAGSSGMRCPRSWCPCRRLRSSLLDAPVNHTARPPLAEHVDVLHRAAARSASYIAGEMLPALAAASLQRHRRRLRVSARRRRDRQARASSIDRQPASRRRRRPRSTPAPICSRCACRSFRQLAADVRRFTALAAPPASWSAAQSLTTFRVPLGSNATTAGRPPGKAAGAVVDPVVLQEARPMSRSLDRTNGVPRCDRDDDRDRNGAHAPAPDGGCS